MEHENVIRLTENITRRVSKQRGLSGFGDPPNLFTVGIKSPGDFEQIVEWLKVKPNSYQYSRLVILHNLYNRLVDSWMDNGHILHSRRFIDRYDDAECKYHSPDSNEMKQFVASMICVYPLFLKDCKIKQHHVKMSKIETPAMYHYEGRSVVHHFYSRRVPRAQMQLNIAVSERKDDAEESKAESVDADIEALVKSVQESVAVTDSGGASTNSGGNSNSESVSD